MPRTLFARWLFALIVAGLIMWGPLRWLIDYLQ